MSLTINSAVSNLAVLKTFAVGEKPVYNKENGEISKEDRERFVWFRRWFFSAFDTDILDQTFRTTIPYLKITEIKVYDMGDPESVKQNIKISQSISEDFLPALNGVKNIIETYRAEKKDQTVKKIQDIYDLFLKEYQNNRAIPFPPPLPAFLPLSEKKKFTRTVVAGVNAAATARSKAVTENYEDAMRRELKLRLTAPLKKVERPSEPKRDKEFSPAFNVSMLRRVSRPSLESVDVDMDEWKVDKPVLLRTQSEKMERPKVQVREEIPVHAKPVKKTNMINAEQFKEHMAAKIQQRRKKLRESPKH